MMMPKDNADAIRALNAYAKGMTYYCGTCQPVYFYNWKYPQYIEIPSTEDVNNYDAYADILMSQYKVGNIFLYPDIYNQDLATYIGTTGTSMLIEMEAPVPAPQFPEGVILRTFNPETDLESVYQADQDSFRDHFGFVDEPFEEGLKRFKPFWIHGIQRAQT